MKDYQKLISLLLAVTTVGFVPLMLSACGTAGSGNITTDGITTSAPETTAEPETTAPQPVEKTLRVGTYNIKHGADASNDMTVLGEIIKKAGLDICGVQEVDKCTNRVNGLDQPAALAEAAGMKYYKFTKAINYQGGEYGTLILSKYPIESFKVTKLESGTKEGRAIGHAVINIDGLRVDFFNTHLSYESTDLRRGQFEQIAPMLAECNTYILTADFNTENFSEFDVLNYGELVNCSTRRHITFPSSNKAIDNIVLSKDFTVADTGTVKVSRSDHRMLWADLTIVYTPEE